MFLREKREISQGVEKKERKKEKEEGLSW